jgi:hypothetical protein
VTQALKVQRDLRVLKELKGLKETGVLLEKEEKKEIKGLRVPRAIKVIWGTKDPKAR